MRSEHFITFQLMVFQKWCENENLDFERIHKFRIKVEDVYVGINLLDEEFYVLDERDEVVHICYAVEELQRWVKHNYVFEEV